MSSAVFGNVKSSYEFRKHWEAEKSRNVEMKLKFSELLGLKTMVTELD
jgi:hypothetical protein